MKTKIICTIGPACNKEESIKELMAAGMSVARVNCSHGTLESNEATIEMLKRVRKRSGEPLAIMLDTKGPDIRIGSFEGGHAFLVNGQKFILTTKPCIGNETKVFVDQKKLLRVLQPKHKIVLNDGFIRMEVQEIVGSDIICWVETGGKLSDRKSLFVPGLDFKLPFLSKADELDLLLAIKTDVDYISASFVSSAKDVLAIRTFLKSHGADIPIIAKIESVRGVQNIDEILNAADGIMTARGDLGVEYPIEQIPTLQKMLSRKAVALGKLVITATEMLESMIEKPRPTRAETTDIANAVYDGACGLMLSGETAIGKYPLQSVRYMKKIAEEAEKHVPYEANFGVNEISVNGTKEAFAKTIISASWAAKAKAIVVFTESGGTAMRVAKYRPGCGVYAHARDEKVYNQMAMINSVTPIYLNEILTTDKMLKIGEDYVRRNKIAKSGDVIIINASYRDTDTDLVLIHPLA